MALTPLEFSMAVIMKLGQYMTRNIFIMPSDEENESPRLHLKIYRPPFPVKSVACMSILPVFLEQAFQVFAIPSVQIFVTVLKIGSLSAKP